MAAQNTDLLKKLSRKWVAQIGSGGVSDDTGTTIPLSTTTNLPSDTAVVATIDRVDSNGTKTASLEETVIGVVSGSNLINCVRGAEGTAQAHSAGAVVEILVTAKGWNDLIDHLLVQHTQLGVHTSALVTSLKCTGSEITASATGDLKIVTPKALADSDVAFLSDITVTASSTTTFTNKRVTPRVVSATSYTTDTGTSLNCDTTDIFIVTAQAGALKFNNPTGTPTDGQKLWIAVTGTAARALTYDTQFEASAAVALPTTTVTTARLDIGFVWRADTSKWRCVASS